MSKYKKFDINNLERLNFYLNAYREPHPLTLTLLEIESIIGAKLPMDANEGKWWWNEKRSRKPSYWMNAGFETVNCKYISIRRNVTFMRINKINSLKETKLTLIRTLLYILTDNEVELYRKARAVLGVFASIATILALVIVIFTTTSNPSIIVGDGSIVILGDGNIVSNHGEQDIIYPRESLPEFDFALDAFYQERFDLAIIHLSNGIERQYQSAGTLFDFDIASMKMLLGQSHRRLSEYDLALMYFREALVVFDRVAYDELAPIMIRNEIGKLLNFTRHYDEAISVFYEALEFLFYWYFPAVHGEDFSFSMDIISTRCNDDFQLYGIQGFYFSLHSYWSAIIHDHLALAYLCSENHDMAMEHSYRSLLRWMNKSVSYNYAFLRNRTINASIRLRVYLAKEDFNLAYLVVNWLAYILDTYDTGLPSLQIAIIYDGIGVALTKIGYPENALSHHMNALSIFRRVLGHENIHIAIVYSNLGLAYFRMGDDGLALVYYYKSISAGIGQLRNYGGRATMHNHISNIYINKGNYEQAIKHAEVAVFYQVRLRGYENVFTISHYWFLARLYRESGRVEDALRILNIIAPASERVLDPNIFEEALLIARIYVERFEISYFMQEYVQSREYFMKAALSMDDFFTSRMYRDTFPVVGDLFWYLINDAGYWD